MSRNTRSPQSSADPTTSPTRDSRTSRRAVLLAAGATAVAMAGGGAAYWGHRNEQEDARLAQRPGLVNPDAPTLGDATARVKIVEFLDPACETCAQFYPIVKKVLADNPGRIQLAVRHVPLHPGAEDVVALLEASRAQDKYWLVLETLLQTQNRWVRRHVVQPQLALQVLEGVGLDWDQLAVDMASDPVKQRVARDRGDAALLNVKATPEYFVNGRQMETFGRQQLLDLIDRALRKAYS